MRTMLVAAIAAVALVVPVAMGADTKPTYTLYDKLWYPLHVDSTLGLGREAVEGVDYVSTIDVDARTFPNGTVFAWQVPDRPPQHAGVYGYPHLSWGSYERKPSTSAVVPARVAEIAELSVELTFTRTGTSNGASVLNEFYLLSNPNDPNSKLFEVGIYAHVAENTRAYMDRSKSLGSFVDPSGVEWVAVVDDGGDAPFIMFRTADGTDVSGVIDWKAKLDFLADLEIISGEEWFTGLAIGPEPRSGEGQIAVPEFEVNYAIAPRRNV